MTDSLAVAVNRDGLHTLAVPTEFEADGPFDVVLRNHGEAAHVHVNLDDRLSEVARIKATNHYIDGGESRRIEVEVRDRSTWPDERIHGKLKVVVGHGQKTHHANITLDSTPEHGEVRVDPDLATPNADGEPESPPLLKLLPVILLGSVAVLLGAGTVFVPTGTALALGALALAAAGLCGASAYYLFT